jgi:hypothetical protein
MSRENVAVVRRWIELFNRRDTEGLIGLTEPDFEMKSRLLAIESDFRGHADFPHAYFEALDDSTSTSSPSRRNSSTQARPWWW